MFANSFSGGCSYVPTCSHCICLSCSTIVCIYHVAHPICSMLSKRVFSVFHGIFRRSTRHGKQRLGKTCRTLGNAGCFKVRLQNNPTPIPASKGASFKPFPLGNSCTILYQLETTLLRFALRCLGCSLCHFAKAASNLSIVARWDSLTMPHYISLCTLT